MNKEFVLTSFRDGVFSITLNRGQKSNCYDDKMIIEVIHSFQEVRHIPEARVIYLNSVGKNFCTGADLDWMKKSQKLSPEENYRDMEKIKLMYQEILHAELPIVGRLHGLVSGGGMGLALACDITACDQSAMFSLPESGIGLIPGIITPIITNKIGNNAFLEMSLTGKIINSEQARKMNMVNFTGDTLEVEKYLNSVLNTIKNKSPLSIKKIIETSRHYDKNLDQELEFFLNHSSKMRQSPEFYEYINKQNK